MLKYNSKIENKLIKKFEKNGFLVFDINQNKIDKIKKSFIFLHFPDE